MSTRTLAFAVALALGTATAFAADEKPVEAKVPSMQEILDASPKADWRTLDPDRTLYVEVPAGRVVIELAPDFAPEHVANIRTLAKEGYWDGLFVIRSQDNYVAQWGDAEEDEAKMKKTGSAKKKLPVEFERSDKDLPFTRLPDVDGWAPQVGFSEGFPAARDPNEGKAWLAHCYGMVGAGRGNESDSSDGTSLYAVTGQSPRMLDRNITLVGRVVQGIELLSTLPRGTGALGFYEDPKQYVPITAKLASSVPDADRTQIELLRTDSKTFATVVESRRNRKDTWYKRPAGHIDLCNVPLPSRKPK